MTYVIVTTNVPMKRIQDLLCSALEGGSGYWASVIGVEEPFQIIDRFNKSEILPNIDYPTNPGGALLVLDTEAHTKFRLAHTKFRLDLPAIRRGIQVMADDSPLHFAHFISERDDALTGDVFLQCCLFGKVVYG